MYNEMEMESKAQSLALILPLERALVFYDIESTGLVIGKDRIVQLCLVKIYPDGRYELKQYLVNPETPIDEEAVECHGITDEMVKDKPTFIEMAPDIYDLIEGCDLVGFNMLRFDLPMLVSEFKRVGIDYDHSDVAKVDLFEIEKKVDPRTLAGVVKKRLKIFDFDEMAHNAVHDTEVLIPILAAQLLQYVEELPRDIKKLGELSWGDRVDQSGKFKMKDGGIVFNFSKKRGEKLSDVARVDSGFLSWMLKQDFPADVKKLVREAKEKERQRMNDIIAGKREEGDYDVLNEFDEAAEGVLDLVEQDRIRDKEDPNGETTLDKIKADQFDDEDIPF